MEGAVLMLGEFEGGFLVSVFVPMLLERSL